MSVLKIAFLSKALIISGTAIFIAAGAVATYTFVSLRRAEVPGWVKEEGPLLEASPRARAQLSDYSVIWKRIEGAERGAQAAGSKTSGKGGGGVLEAVGTLFETDEKFRYAILEDEGKKQHLVKVGDNISGFTVLGIEKEEVLVEKDGNEIVLKVVSAAERQAAKSSQGSLKVAQEKQVPTGPGVPPIQEFSAEETPEESYLVVDDPFVITQEQLHYYVENLSTLLSEVRLLNHYDSDGSVDGLLVAEMAPGSVFSKRGFSPGDIIKEVDGTPLTDASQLTAIAQTIVKEDLPFVDVTIERDGEEDILVYELR